MKCKCEILPSTYYTTHFVSSFHQRKMRTDTIHFQIEMGTTASKHPDDHKYEEPVQGEYQYLGEKWKQVDRPRRIMKNPDVPPCVR
jgi:hypothetical protein